MRTNMKLREGEKLAEEKGKTNDNEMTLAAAEPAPFPMFPFGLFLLPLIVPGISPAETKDNK
jgi:hypothetical protein